jgi:ribonuclease G
MRKEILVNTSLEETKVAVLENGMLFDLFIERRESKKILNNIYKGRVKNIVPALDSAFVDIGFGKSTYLSVCDIVPFCEERNIEKMIKIGQEILVQIYKEPIGTKGPKVTMNVSLPGRLLVYIPFGKGIGISKNIENKQEYNRLKNMISKFKKDISVSGGVIVRTECEGASEEEIKNEIKYLTTLWISIVERFNYATPMSLVHKDLGVVFQIIRDYFSDDVVLMQIDSKKELKAVTDFVKIVSPDCIDKIVFYDGKTPIFRAYGIEGEINKLRSNKVKLRSGGYIVIQEAESLCSIDVNSGKFTSRSTQEDTAIITNLEAADEIARQLRLRNIGGIVVIDFIDMKKVTNRQKTLEKFRKATKGDKAKIKIWPITKLGLIEMTRERKRESLFFFLGDTCPICRGLGLILSKESIFSNVCDEIEQLKVDDYEGRIKLNLNPDIVEYFKERKFRLKELFNTDFDIMASTEILREEYQIIFE